MIQHCKIFLSTALVGLILQACGGVQGEARYPTGLNRENLEDQNAIYEKPDSVFGKDLNLFGGEAKKADNGIGVNSYLWRATLDTISFMPLASADPFGGVIITDWYAAPETPDERFKLNVFILSEELRSDGVKVRAFRQQSVNGEWQDSEVSRETARALEDSILSQARALKVASAQ